MTQQVKETTKTGTYFIMHLTVAIIVAYAITQDLTAALAIGLAEPLVQTIAYHFHERFWKTVPVKQS